MHHHACGILYFQPEHGEFSAKLPLPRLTGSEMTAFPYSAKTHRQGHSDKQKGLGESEGAPIFLDYEALQMSLYPGAFCALQLAQS